jgi:hypothetical protein
VGATVIADARQNAGDAAMAATVGDGGVPGEIDAGNVSNLNVKGNGKVYYINALLGPLELGNAQNVTVTDKTDLTTLMKLKNVGTLLFDGDSPKTIPGIKSTGTINTLQVEIYMTVTGDITAEAIGKITGTGGLTGNNITTTGNIGGIDIGSLKLGTPAKRQATNVKTISCQQLGAVDVAFNLTANIRATKGVTGMLVGSLVNAASRKDGTYGDFIGSVIVTAGDVGPISVAGNFDLPSNNVRLGASLVQAPGVIHNIQVQGNIGSTNSLKNSAKIVGNDIRIIQSTGGNISLSQILASITKAVPGTTPVGGIKAVLATNGELQAALESEGGSIGTVEAKTVEGNIKAQATGINPWPNAPAWNPNVGGDIEFVSSVNAIPNNVKFQAWWYIGKIEVRAAKTTEKFQVWAQGGDLNNGTYQHLPGPLVIDVGGVKFLGVVLFRRSGVPQAIAEFTTAGVPMTLLQVTAENKTTKWTLQGPAGQTTTIEAKFAELKDGTFGLLKNKTTLSNNQLSIGGPAGNPG